jgi:signal transduction histidine kinase
MSIGGEPHFTGILHDLTIRVGFETQLREQAALARLGEMAAVLAHEIRNPLAAIRAAIQVIGGRLPPESQEARVMLDVIARVDALNGLMRDLLLFARPPQPKTTQVELAPLLTTTAALLKQDPALARIQIQIDGTAPPVIADPDLLTIVFQNLLINGAHAMDGQGTLRVSITTTQADCQVAIADSGPGIPADLRETIFRPFFTTKSRGTGLGLPTAKRIIDAHLGRILIDCPAEGGTTFTVHLPR